MAESRKKDDKQRQTDQNTSYLKIIFWPEIFISSLKKTNKPNGQLQGGKGEPLSMGSAFAFSHCLLMTQTSFIARGVIPRDCILSISSLPPTPSPVGPADCEPGRRWHWRWRWSPPR